MFNIFDKNVSDADVLFYVCRKGDLESVKVVVDKFVKNTDKKLVQDTLYSALVLACINGFEDIIIFLLSLGLNVNIIDDISESTALIESCRYNNPEIIELLLKSGAEVNKQNNKGITPLMIACAYNNSEIIELLINKGSDINLKSHTNNTALTLLCNHNNHKIIELLIKKGAEINLTDTSMNQPLIVACRNNNLDIVRLLIDNGADVKSRCNTGGIGWEALIVACRNNNLDIVRLLIDNGADINLKNMYGFSALNVLEYSKHKELKEKLLSLNLISSNFND